MGTVSKEVDAWLGDVQKLLKEHAVAEVPQAHLKSLVEQVLKEIGLEKLKEMEATDVLVEVRDRLPKLPGNMLNPDFVAKKSDVVAKIVEGFYSANKIRSGGLQTFGDGVVNELEARIAGYIAQLPKDVTIKRDGLTLVLSKRGVAAKVKTKIADIDADVGGASNKLRIDTKDLKLKFENEGKSLRFDAELAHVRGDLEILAELHARRGKFSDDASGEAVALDARIEATYKDVHAKIDASLQQFTGKIQYLQKKPGLKEISAKLESDYKKVRAALKLSYEKKDTALLVKAVAAADKLEVEINAKTITAGGFDVKGELKASLERVDAKIEVFRKQKDADLKFVARLESDYKDLKAAADLAYKSSGKVQVELIAKFEATLDRVKTTIEASLAADTWRITAAAGLDTQGGSSGKVEALLKLGDGLQLMGQNAYLKVAAGVDAKQWNVFVGISLTNPPRAADVNKLIRAAEGNINRAYGVLDESAFDSAESAAILSEMQKRLKAPPPKVGLEAGFFLGGDLPKSGMPNLPMVGGVGLKISWF
jgi:hypothetical protein